MFAEKQTGSPRIRNTKKCPNQIICDLFFQAAKTTTNTANIARIATKQTTQGTQN